MHCSDVSLPGAAFNLAADEALLDWCEEGQSGPILRFWEPAEYFVVVGYGNRVHEEVNVGYCRDEKIPIFRRCTGGGTVLQGPGVLNYTLILKIDSADGTGTIPSTNKIVMERQRRALEKALHTEVHIRGQSDLAVLDVKCCGNAQRRKKSFLIFHGSFLLSLDAAMIEKTLRMPSKQPDYRKNRSHSDFVRNVSVQPNDLKKEIRAEWGAHQVLDRFPLDRIENLAAEKYSTDEWNFRF